MVNKIVRLADSVIQQIAAGEVVESPASIVKELIENSLDAGASQITVRMQEDFLEVEDDGCGMNQADAVLCLERYATSKIREAKDLFLLSTMGFRGEALAAISAVSHFSITTSEGGLGTCVKGKGGEIEQVFSEARNRGTTVRVESLFFNVPARKKFQKSASSRSMAVSQMVDRMALAHPSVTFVYQTKKYDKKSHRERVEEILGPFAYESKQDNIWGLLGAPSEAKEHRRGQCVFINQRPVFCPLIAKAVQQGYGTRLAKQTYPSFVLFLELDPSAVDVNVHPQKKEVRLAFESQVFQKVEAWVQAAFLQSQENYLQPLKFSPPDFSFVEPPSFPTLQHTALLFELPSRVLFVLGPFALFEQEGWWLLDLRAAEAHICLETLLKKNKESQTLLWPLLVSSDEADTVDRLQEIGVECRWVSSSKIAVDAFPSVLSDFALFFEAWKEGKTLSDAVFRFSHRKKQYSQEEAQVLFRKQPERAKKIEVKDLEQWIASQS